MDGLSEVQHLLRHLNDLAGLRKNPLVASLFARADIDDHELHAHVRHVVLTAVDGLAWQQGKGKQNDSARWQDIIRRCDLQGELHMNVAADLGLSARQFYRVRRSMHEVLLKAIPRDLERLGTDGQRVPTTQEVGIDLARSLRDHGRPADAASLLLDVASSAPEPAQRLSALAELSLIYREMRRTDELQQLVESATTLCYGPAAKINPLHEAEVCFSQSMLALSRNDLSAHVELLKRAENFTLASAPTHRALDLHLQVELALTEAHTTLGNAALAMRYSAAAHQRLNQRPGFIRRRAELAYIDGATAAFRGKYRESLACFNESLSHAREANLSKIHMQAYTGIATVQLQLENYSAARLNGRNGLLFASTISDRSEAAWAMAALGWIELEANHPQQAIALLRTARTKFPHTSFMRYMEDALMAAALARLGRVAEAVPMIEASCEEMKHRQLFRHLGRHEVMRAEIYARAGRPDDARASIHQALEILQTNGTHSALANAYRVSAVLTGNVQHKARAAEMKAEFSAARA